MKKYGGPGEMKADVGECGDEVEQHAEADGVDRQQRGSRRWGEHLLYRTQNPPDRTKLRSRGSASVTIRPPASVNKATRCKGGAPADQVGDHASKEPTAEAADTRAGNKQSGNARYVGRRPFVANIGDGDGEDRRQQQTLHEPQDHELRHARSEGHDQCRHDDSEGGGGDQALAAENISERTGEWRGQRDRQGARGHQRANLARPDAEFMRQFGQQRLGRVEIDKGGKAGRGNGQRTNIESHDALWASRKAKASLLSD